MAIQEYIKETQAELAHVSWATRKQWTQLTIAVVAVSLGVAAFLGLFDYLFIALLRLFV